MNITEVLILVSIAVLYLFSLFLTALSRNSLYYLGTIFIIILIDIVYLIFIKTIASPSFWITTLILIGEVVLMVSLTYLIAIIGLKYCEKKFKKK